jgi:hypothetical protein
VSKNRSSILATKKDNREKMNELLFEEKKLAFVEFQL